MNPDEAINQLSDIRKNKNLWGQFAYSPARNVNDVEIDNNWQSRYALIIALQYNWTSSDEELLQFILENEILCHSRDIGLLDSMHLSSYLLAKFRNPENVFLFYKAKQANFDTYSGYDTEYIFSAGIQQTIDLLTGSDNPNRFDILDRVKGELVDDYIDETRLQEWFEECASVYPITAEKEDKEILIERAIIFGNHKVGKALIHERYRELDSSLYNLSEDAKKLGEYDLAIKAQKKIRLSYSSARDLVASSQRISELHRLAGELNEAWSVLKDCDTELKKFDSWKAINLGRGVIETALKISLGSAQNNPIKKEAFYWAHSLLEESFNISQNISWTVFQTAFEIATQLGDQRLQLYYKKLRDQEKQRMDEMMKRFNANKSKNSQDE